ncbi:type VI secretion system baseplate subunit TssE [Salmonella enterica]|uniref:Type VI secretion system baseplate subunit TssE n=1 Tax=Salmonella enterica subsp. enterica serovar Kintambo TaxID=1192730 RepID=A0A5W7S2L0_SALET|nr:type VI secretion system baseplate subunit TssE [Salmonella enterica subsp. enterica serovar Kintambo]EBZ5774426.1 type VI secretion system baseplate subunit TssE [Salmonella enterica subsp. enterica serovar Redlands]ECE6154472.1 type VI secretion system baseplate subunit TssE [Salmonella enterica subsp. enterica]ELX7028097.1 type VI secretion system baseplate subunit TssE [Salmonella enterica]MLP09036.1 type VI secretion system baseplate subunit TssE [Salmonella enterica subsp. enterica ser
MFRERDRNNIASLFDRLDEATELRSPSFGIQAVRNSIKRNLNNVLNTRPGSCQSAPEMGISDPGSEELTRGSFKDAQIEKIKACIELYEPRIAQVDVVMGDPDENSPLDLCFRVTAFIDIEGLNNVLEFNVHLSSQRYRMD